MRRLALLRIVAAAVLCAGLEFNVPSDNLLWAASEANCSDCVGDDLASLHIELTTLSYRVGQPIPVTLILSAGGKGVYLPNNFADFMASCQGGFSASILTDTGALADPKVVGCAGSIFSFVERYSAYRISQFRLSQARRAAGLAHQCLYFRDSTGRVSTSR
jgi:hypothetical protein